MARHHTWGTQSEAQLGTVDPRLAACATAALRALPFDLTVPAQGGHRDKFWQNHAHETGHSTKRWPDSKHNVYPSLGLDLAPYVNGAIPWEDVEKFKALGIAMLAAAAALDVSLRWGADWDGDWDIAEHNFIDWGHFEVQGKDEAL